MPNIPLNKEEELRLRVFLLMDDYRKKPFRAGQVHDVEAVMKIDKEYEDKIIDIINAAVREAFKAGVSMSGGDLEFQDAFYEQWQLNLKHSQSQPNAKEDN